MTLQGAFQRVDGVFGASLTEQEYRVVDSRVFIGCRSAIQAHRLAESIAGFGDLPERFQRKPQQPVCLAVVRLFPERAAEHIHRRLEAVQQIERASIVEAGIGQRGIAFTRVTKRGFRALEFAARRINDAKCFPGGRIPRPEIYRAL